LALAATPTWAASDPPDLLTTTLTEEAREAEVRRSCSEPLDRARIVRLLSPESPWPAQIDGARLIECAPAGAALDLALSGMAEAKTGLLRNDPDIYERLARSLGRSSMEDVAEAARAIPSETAAAWGVQQACGQWLQPASGEAFDCSSLGTLSDEQVHDAIDAWLDRLRRHPVGLRSLESDRGNTFWFLLEVLQAELLAGLIETGSKDDGLLAAEVARLSIGDHPKVLGAVEQRAQGGDSDWTAALERARGMRSWGERSEYLGDGFDRAWPVDVAPSDIGYERTPPAPGQLPKTIAAWGLALCSLLLILGLALARARPGWRGLVFPGAAMALGVGSVFGLELLLGALGLPAEADSPWESPGPLLETVSIDGAPYLQTTGTAGRYQMMTDQPRDGGCRVATLGASSVHGSYYAEEDAFAAVLERRLARTGPSTEVINLGVGAATSNEVRASAIEALDVGAHVLVVYLGNNDLEHLPLTADLVAASAESVGSQALLERSRVARVLKSWIGRSTPTVNPAAEPGEPLLDDAPLEGPRLQLLLSIAAQQATENVRGIVREAERRGAGVVVVQQLLNEVYCPPGRDGDKERSCFNDRLRGIAEGAVTGTHAVLVDGPAALREDAGGPAGHDHFRDFVHPSRRGHAVLGEAIAPSVRRLLEGRCGR
jgi:lysophospholipase L1-like esterase